MTTDTARQAGPKRAARSARERHGFTLIELLVVISILALLVAMLTPYLTKAREIAKRAICMQYERSIGTAILGFAVTHGGRGPGGASYPDSSVAWQDVLDNEWFRAGTIPRIMGQTPAFPKGTLLCPSWKFWTDGSGRSSYCSRTLQLNEDVTGGPNWGNQYLNVGPYGQIRDANYFVSMYPPRATGNLSWYCLGGILDKFKNQNQTFMLVESEYANDVFYGPPSSMNLYGANGVPGWATPGSLFSFRHCLPPDPTLYQAQATGVFTYIDGHIAIQNAQPELLGTIHWYLNPDNPGAPVSW